MDNPCFCCGVKEAAVTVPCYGCENRHSLRVGCYGRMLRKPIKEVESVLDLMSPFRICSSCPTKEWMVAKVLEG